MENSTCELDHEKAFALYAKFKQEIQDISELDEKFSEDYKDLCTFLRSEDPEYLGEAESIVCTGFLGIGYEDEAKLALKNFLTENQFNQHICNFKNNPQKELLEKTIFTDAGMERRVIPIGASLIIIELDKFFTLSEACELENYLEKIDEPDLLLLIKFIIRRINLKDQIKQYEYNVIKSLLKECEKPFCDIDRWFKGNNCSRSNFKRWINRKGYNHIFDKATKIDNYFTYHPKECMKLKKELPQCCWVPERLRIIHGLSKKSDDIYRKRINRSFQNYCPCNSLEIIGYLINCFNSEQKTE